MNKKARQKHMKLFENSKCGCSQSRKERHKPVAGNTSLNATACCSIGKTDRRAYQIKNKMKQIEISNSRCSQARKG